MILNGSIVLNSPLSLAFLMATDITLLSCLFPLELLVCMNTRDDESKLMMVRVKQKPTITVSGRELNPFLFVILAWVFTKLTLYPEITREIFLNHLILAFVLGNFKEFIVFDSEVLYQPMKTTGMLFIR